MHSGKNPEKYRVISELILLNRARVRLPPAIEILTSTWMCLIGYLKAGINPKIIGKISIKNIEPLTNFIIRGEE
jgi:hypothetical protein